ncbi:acetyl-CoA carboxylase [Burkholderia aenigmatica]|uniref:Acetyl-CoA carboxylase n=1 Tax=Burkholderia aenigmatica TaxID=2015348 RepID=A0ABY6XXT8_9BURK|nr:hypothetical protein [Burkholderia aenigmatica]VWD01809.1 acetyl-CoA carboxylase [Burkholderia aenigmatica]
MNEIKHTPGPWGISAESPTIIKQFDLMGETPVIIGSATGYTGSPFFPSEAEAVGNALHFAASFDMAEALELIAAEDDAARHNGKPLLTSGVRLALDAALIKAGRKAAPEKMRHITIAGVD